MGQNPAGPWPSRTGFGHPRASHDAAEVRHPLRHLRFADSDRRNTLERRLSPPPTLPLTL